MGARIPCPKCEGSTFAIRYYNAIKMMLIPDFRYCPKCNQVGKIKTMWSDEN